MTGLDLSRAQWKKSSYSGNTGNCLEVARLGHTVVVRDSKDPDGLVLMISSDGWTSLLAGITAQQQKPKAALC